MPKKPKVPKSWLKDPLFAAPKKAHARHPFEPWQSAWPLNWDARRCSVKGCRCMHWCCYQQRNPRRRALVRTGAR
jgi:hypothetical protein